MILFTTQVQHIKRLMNTDIVRRSPVPWAIEPPCQGQRRIAPGTGLLQQASRCVAQGSYECAATRAAPT